MDIAAIQTALSSEGIDGWLLYDAHGLNPIARRIVGIHGVVTRRWFVLVPSRGEPRAVYHRIEAIAFREFPGQHRQYRTWQELDAALTWILDGPKTAAMEYSPDNAIPYVARVDAATIEKVRARGVQVVSSADLVAQFLAVWTPEQVVSHRNAAIALLQIKDAAFARIRGAVHRQERITEFEIVEFMRGEFARRGMTNDDEGPICAVDANAGNPHYEPKANGSATISANQLVLIDLWAKCVAPGSVYADITWTGYTGPRVPQRIHEVFGVVARARDRAISYLEEAFAQAREVHGFEVDRAVRKTVVDSGYGEFFIHRTGHSLGRSVHDVGPNIDDLETQDRRRLRNGLAFTIEPGIYLPDFGIRSEINVLIENNRPVVTTLPLQTEVIALA